MTRSCIAYHKFELDLVFHVTRIIEMFTFGTFEGGTNCHPWVWNIIIVTSVEDLANIHQPYHLDL